MTEQERQEKIAEHLAALKELLTIPRSDWHTAFEALLRLDTYSFSELVHINTEVEIGLLPPRADFVMLIMDENVDLGKSIFKIFKKHNIIEYKNPRDSLNERVIRKVAGYANFYIGTSPNEKDRPADQVTASIFRHSKNQKLFKKWKANGKLKEGPAEGIYFVEGFGIPLQIVITSELKGAEYAAYRALSDKAKEADVQSLVDDYNTEKEEIPKEYITALLQLVLDKNPQYFEMIRSELGMSEEAKTLFFKFYKEDVEEERKKAKEQEQIKIANNFLALGINNESIAKGTGLPLSTIEELAKKKIA